MKSPEFVLDAFLVVPMNKQNSCKYIGCQNPEFLSNFGVANVNILKDYLA